MTRKISTKIFILFSCLIAVCSIVFFIFFNSLVRDIHISIIEREIEEKARITEVLVLMRIQNGRGTTDELHALALDVSRLINLRLTIIDQNGLVIADSDLNEKSADNHLWRREIQQAIKEGSGKSIRYSNSLKINMLYVAKKAGPYVIRLAKPLTEIDANVSNIRNIIVIFSSILFVFALIIAVILSRVITNPIDEAIRFAWDFSRGDLSRRIMNFGDDEIGKLQSALNSLADALQDKINGYLLEQNKLAATVQNIHEGIALVDTNKHIVIHNRAFASFLNIDFDARDRSYFEVIRSSGLNAKIEYTLASSSPCSFEEELQQGTVCEVYISPISADSTLNGVLVVLHDITERKRIARLKSDLVGNLSHELKTPITILKGYLETIKECRSDPETTQGLIDKALMSVERQSSIINDMLKLNMLETTRSFQPENVDLVEVIVNCLNLLNPKILEKRLNAICRIEELPGIIRANRFLAEEIIFNIIDNAINYNKYDGSITIVAQKRSRRLSISIADTGIGIPPDSLDRIFERFYRVNKSRSRATGGTGLGLSIVKHAAELLNWDVGVASTEAGSTFTVEIPLGMNE